MSTSHESISQSRDYFAVEANGTTLEVTHDRVNAHTVFNQSGAQSKRLIKFSPGKRPEILAQKLG